ncbi:MAG: hypothetical protein JXR19_05770 [Bacteroidia bacterium]
MMKKLTLTIAFLSFLGFTSHAQWEDYDDSYDSEGTYDDYDYDENGGGTTTTDSTDEFAEDDGWGDWDGGESFDAGGYSDLEYVRSARPKFEHRPYERFSGMPYDSATELVTYVEVVEVITPDSYLDLEGIPYDTEDSLQARAIQWMTAQFGEKQAKKMIEESGPDGQMREGLTINAIAEVPLLVQMNEFSKRASGILKFDIELRFKDQRYRYKFNNFVHVEEDFIEGKEPIETYIEYYMDAKANIEDNDRILIATNNTVNDMIDALKQTCSRVPFIDDDSW